MGTTDANGIYIVEETDAISPFHTFMNTIQAATSNALNATARIFRATSLSAMETLRSQRGASAAQPLYVHRTDLDALFRHNGVQWRRIDLLAEPQGNSNRDAAVKMGTNTIGTNENGDGGLTFDSPFPNQLLSVNLQDASSSSAYGIVHFKWTSPSSDRTRFTFRAYGSNGLPLPNFSVAVGWTAWGR